MMLSALLVTLREGVEAALVVAIVVAALARLGRKDLTRIAWSGVGAAVLVSFVAGALLFATAGGLEGRAEQVFEGAAMFTAVAVLTYMVFWMARQGAAVSSELRDKTAKAVARGSGSAVFALTFVAVLREGLETALFLFSTVRSAEPVAAGFGAVAGLALAGALGVAIYRAGAALPLRTFFAVTGVLIVLVAAGLLGHGVHEWQEAGILPVTVEHVWDTSAVLSQEGLVGGLARSLFGYSDSPSLLEVVSYFAYLLTVGVLWARRLRLSYQCPAAERCA
jgi:high-affinity iron transporter